MRPVPAILCALVFGSAAQAETFEFDGLSRRYLIEKPADAGDPAPALFLLHGGYGSGAQLRDSLTAPLPKGWVIVFPDATGRQWNDGRTLADGTPVKTVDDVGFLSALAEDLARRRAIDGDRIYFAGISNGGMMSIRMACDRPDLVAGIGVVASAMPAGFDCKAGEPLATIFIHGTEDQLIPYDGGRVAEGVGRGRDRGEALSIPQSLAFFADNNDCDGAGERKKAPDPVRDGTRASYELYRGCDAPLAYVEIEGGGHSWPGAERKRFQKKLGGAVSEDFDATATMATFFATGEATFPPAPQQSRRTGRR